MIFMESELSEIKTQAIKFYRSKIINSNFIFENLQITHSAFSNQSLAFTRELIYKTNMTPF